MRPDIGRPDVGRPDVGRPDVDRPGVDLPDIEPGRFANIMSAQGDHAFQRVKAVERETDSTAVSRPQTHYTTLLSGAATFEAPQVGGVLQTAVADFTLGVIEGILGDETVEASDLDDLDDFDSDDTSDEEDAKASAPRTLAQKKELRAKHCKTYMGVRDASPMGPLDPRGGTQRLIALMRATPGT